MKTHFLPFALLIITIGLVSCTSTQKAQTSNLQNTGDNSMNSLDWNGTYQGILPCADCEGIQTQIILSNDLNYVLETRYNGKDEKIFQTKGIFKWDESGSKIIFDNPTTQMYQVGENKLFQLDKNGNRITGELAGNYILEKETIEITGKYWKLVELNNQPIKVENRKPFIKFDKEENRVNGNNSCNSFNGNYEINEGNKMKFSPFMMTKMACIDNNTEGEFMRALESAETYSLTNNSLILHNSENINLAKFQSVYFDSK